MPTLENLNLNFDLLEDKEKVTFWRAYRKRRYEDLAKPPTYGYRASAERNSSVRLQTLGLTPEEIQLAKTLGLKPQDIMRLRKAGGK